VRVVSNVERECTSEFRIGELVVVLDDVGVFVLSTPSDCQADDMLHFTASVKERNSLEVTVIRGIRKYVDSEQIQAVFKLWQVACKGLDGEAVEEREILGGEVVGA
jgi:hypothetical protein